MTSTGFSAKSCRRFTLIAAGALICLAGHSDLGRVPAIPGTSATVSREGVPPQGLSAQDWAGVRAQIERERYRLEPGPPESGRFSGANPAQQLKLQFSESGLRASLRRRGAGETGSSLRLRTLNFGRPDHLRELETVAPGAAGDRVEYPRAGITEWFVNRAAGLEHGYTISSRPPGDGRVQIELALDGDFAAEAAGEGSVVLRDRLSGATLRYEKLVVQDAAHRTLPAHLAVQGERSLLLAFDDRAAAYPVTVDPLLINETAKLTIEGDGGQRNAFGSSVAVDGNTLVIGDPDALRSGAVYVYERTGGEWALQARLITDCTTTTCNNFGASVAISGDTVVAGSDLLSGTAFVFTRSNGQWTQHSELVRPIGEGRPLSFGASLAISGNTVVVGAPGVSPDVGAAYVFAELSGTWSLQATLTPAGGQARDRFGDSVAITDGLVVVGAPLEDRTDVIQGTVTADVGAAYVFTVLGSPVTKLTAADGAESDQFGGAVAISGSTVAVGAPGDDDNLSANTGAVYVFSTTGTQLTRLMATDRTPGDVFGAVIALPSESFLAVGAAGHDGSSGADSGAVYLFGSVEGTWSQQAMFAGAAAGDRFGRAIAISGADLVVGATGADTAFPDAGGTHVFTGSGATWNEVQQIAMAEGAYFDYLGYSMALFGETLVVGAPYDDTPAGDGAGSAYVFKHAGDAWSKQARLLASDGVADDNFGFSLALDGGTLIVGAPSHFFGSGAGSAYIFTESGGVWTEQAKLIASDGQAYDEFGYAVAISGGVVAVGAPGSFCDVPGSAYVFTGSGSVWSEQAKLTPSDSAVCDEFGSSMAISDAALVIGAPGGLNAPGNAAGAAYVFTGSDGAWSQRAKLTASDGEPYDKFGFSVAISGRSILVGAMRDDTAAGVTDAGSAYVFTGSGEAWIEQAKLEPSGSVDYDWFGTVAIAGGAAVVGTSYETYETGGGAAHVFTCSGGTWSERARLTASDGRAGDYFGTSVVISSGTVVVGAPEADTAAGLAAGAAYVYDIFSLQTHTAPEAESDTIEVQQGEPADVDVLANDTDDDCDALSVQSVGVPTHGAATVSAARDRVRYVPAAGFVGRDKFGYTITDDDGGTATGAVIVTVVARPAADEVTESVTSGPSGESGSRGGAFPGRSPLDAAILALLLLLRRRTQKLFCRRRYKNRPGISYVVGS